MQFTGKIGDVIDISGNGFSRVSRVLFSEAKSRFETVSDTLIKARVPEGAAWDYIKIISDERNVTGVSSQKFCPEPLIEDYSLKSGVYGDSISITGKAFSGIYEATFNGITGAITAHTNYYATATVPSGDVRGDLIIHGQSGLSNTARIKFSPEVLVTGFSPTSGITGTSINIYGKYFFDELMYTGNQSGKYLVSYGKNIYSGYVEKISDTHLSGKIPAELVDGPISIARNDSVEGAVQYYSADPFAQGSRVDFNVLGLGPPAIIASSTITGFYSSYYGNQPIIFNTKNIGTDKNGRGLSIGLLNSSSTGSFLSGASGLVEITESSNASQGVNWAWTSNGRVSDQASQSGVNVFGEPGEYNFFDDIYCPCPPGESQQSCGKVGIDCDINEPFYTAQFSADPEESSQGVFQAFASPTEEALEPGEYFIAVHQEERAPYGLEASRAISNVKVKMLASIVNSSITFGFDPTTFGQTAGSSVQIISGKQYLVSYNSAGVAVNTGIHKSPGFTKNTILTAVQSCSGCWRNFGLRVT
jgi:hypothetical protein